MVFALSEANTISIGLFRSLMCVVFACNLLQATPVTVYSVGPSSVPVGSSVVFSLEADLAVSILGWGLDVEGGPYLSLSNIQIGDLWLPVAGIDQDGLAGIAFPLAVSGDAIGLARLTFTAVRIGHAFVTASVTSGDLTEGFLAEDGSFVDLEFLSRSFEVTPSDVASPELPTAFYIAIGIVLLYIARLTRKRLHEGISNTEHS